MAQTLNLSNFDTSNILVRTRLISDISASINSLPVDNSQGFVAGPILLGNPGRQTSEMLTATTPLNSTSIPTSSVTKLNHNWQDDVSMLFGDQIRIYRANDRYQTGQQPPDTDFVLIATISIVASSSSTSYTDAAGVSGQWYKSTYFNSSSSSETSLADSIAAQAGQVHYVSIDEIRSAAGFKDNPNITDDLIAQKRDTAEKEIIGSLLPVYQFPLPQPTNPIIVEIAKQLAAGILMHEAYINVSPTMAEKGELKAKQAREGGGSFTGLYEVAVRDVVLTDANFNEQTISEGHGFGGLPDATTIDAESQLNAPYFAVDKEY